MRFSAASEQFISWGSGEIITGARYLTEFGGVTGVLIVLSLAYWLGPRRQILTLFGIVTAGLLVIVSLKELIAMSRPPADTAAIDPTDPYGFPSGHAFSAVITYGGLAAVFGWLRSLPGVVTVSVFVGAIALSRVILGVHYLGDVIGGIVIGVIFLSVMLWVTAGQPYRAFGTAFVCLLPAFVFVETTVYLWTALGMAVGGIVIAILGVDSLPSCEKRFDCGVVIGAGAIILVVLQRTTTVVTDGPLLAGVFAVGFAGILGTPLVLAARPDQILDRDID